MAPQDVTFYQGKPFYRERKKEEAGKDSSSMNEFTKLSPESILLANTSA
jgi:hypothetical protein